MASLITHRLPPAVAAAGHVRPVCGRGSALIVGGAFQAGGGAIPGLHSCGRVYLVGPVEAAAGGGGAHGRGSAPKAAGLSWLVVGSPDGPRAAAERASRLVTAAATDDNDADAGDSYQWITVPPLQPLARAKDGGRTQVSVYEILQWSVSSLLQMIEAKPAPEGTSVDDEVIEELTALYDRISRAAGKEVAVESMSVTWTFLRCFVLVRECYNRILFRREPLDKWFHPVKLIAELVEEACPDDDDRSLLRQDLLKMAGIRLEDLPKDPLKRDLCAAMLQAVHKANACMQTLVNVRGKLKHDLELEEAEYSSGGKDEEPAAGKDDGQEEGGEGNKGKPAAAKKQDDDDGQEAAGAEKEDGGQDYQH